MRIGLQSLQCLSQVTNAIFLETGVVFSGIEDPKQQDIPSREVTHFASNCAGVFRHRSFMCPFSKLHPLSLSPPMMTCTQHVNNSDINQII